MNNTCVFPSDLASAIASCSPLSRYVRGNGTVQYRTQFNSIPASYTKHRQNTTRVVNKLFVLDAASKGTRVKDLVTKFGPEAELTPAMLKSVQQALMSGGIAKKRPATATEVAKYIEAERKLTLWRLKHDAADMARTAKWIDKRLSAALGAATMIEKIKKERSAHQMKMARVDNLLDLMTLVK